MVLTLVSHLMVTFGFPMPSPSHKKPTDGVPYPCQSRPCGCLSSEECWKGDCCCFTLEEKLAWAEANGVEPPVHVRPLVESRKSRPTAPKKKSCCSECDPAPKPSIWESPSCCAQPKPVTECCNGKLACKAAPDAECPHCTNKAKTNCCENKTAPTTHRESSVRWVVGIFLKKCKGEGPAGHFQLEPSVVPDLTPGFLTEPEHDNHIAPCSDLVISVIHSPPTPPPRSH